VTRSLKQQSVGRHVAPTHDPDSEPTDLCCYTFILRA